ncbi:unnamed protein product [Bubo scandiacus]
MNSNETEKTLKEIRGKVPDAQTEAECGPKSLRQLVIKRTLAWTGNESGTPEININLLMSCPDVLRNPFFSSTLWYFSNQQLGWFDLLGNGNQNTISDLIFSGPPFPTCMYISLIYKGYFKDNYGKNGKVLGVDCAST